MDGFFTGFPQKLWKTMALCACILLACPALLPGCSRTIKGQKVKPASAPCAAEKEKDLSSMDEEGVRKTLGEPTTMSRTAEGHILWIYEPSWKLIPDDKGNRYVEFENGHVIKTFRIK
jgi:hypothetical protein